MPSKKTPYPSALHPWTPSKDSQFTKKIVGRTKMSETQLLALKTTIAEVTPPLIAWDVHPELWKQPAEVLEAVRAKVIEQHPELLDSFENAWPVEVLMMSFIYENLREEENKSSVSIYQTEDPAALELERQGGQLSELDALKLLAVLQAGVIRLDPNDHPVIGASVLAQGQDETSILNNRAVTESLMYLLSLPGPLHPTSRLFELVISWAAKEDDVAIMRAFVEKADALASAGVKLYSGLTPLRVLAFYGAVKSVRLLLDMGAPLHSVFHAGGLMPPCIEKMGHRGCVHMEVLLELVKRGGTPTHADLAHAVRAGSQEAVQAIIERRPDFLVEPTKAGDLLQGALSNGHSAIVEFFLLRGARLTYQHLEAAAASGYRAHVQLIVERVERSPTDAGHLAKALDAALKKGFPDIAEFLIVRGNAPCTYAHLVQATKSGLVEVVSLILDRGVHPNGFRTDTHPEGTSTSALVHAILGKHYKIVELLSTRAQPKPMALCYLDLEPAAAAGDIELVKKIVIPHTNDRKLEILALQAAFMSGHDNMVELLLRPYLRDDEVISFVRSLRAIYSHSHFYIYSVDDNIQSTFRDAVLCSRPDSLVRFDPPPEYKMYREFRHAARTGCIDTMAEILSKPGAEDGFSTDGSSMLYTAVCAGQSRAAAWLVEHGVRFTAFDLLEAARWSVNPKNPVDDVNASIMPTIVAGGVTVEPPPEEIDNFTYGVFDPRIDNSALRSSLLARSPAVAEFLVRKGASGWREDGKGTALQIAAREGYAHVARALLECDAEEPQYVDADDFDVDEDDTEATETGPPLRLALDAGHDDIVEMLLLYGADVTNLEDGDARQLERVLTPELWDKLPVATRIAIAGIGMCS